MGGRICVEKYKWGFEKLKQKAEKRNRETAASIFCGENTRLTTENTKFGSSEGSQSAVGATRTIDNPRLYWESAKNGSLKIFGMAGEDTGYG